MERRQGGGNDRRPDLAAVSGAVPHAPRLRRRPVGRFCSGPGPRPGACACLPVRLSVPMVEGVRLQLRRRARPRLRALANTRPSSPRVRDARRTPSCGPIRRRASTTIRERAITGKPDGARICARLTLARPDTAPHGAVNARPRTLQAKDLRRALSVPLGATLKWSLSGGPALFPEEVARTRSINSRTPDRRSYPPASGDTRDRTAPRDPARSRPSRRPYRPGAA